MGTPGAAQQRVVVWVVGFDARNYAVDERDEKVAVSLTARYVGGGLPAPEFNSMHYLSISSAPIKVAGVETEATSPEDYAGVSVSRAFPEDSSGPDKGFSDVDGDGTYETTYTFDQGIVWDAEYEGPDGERFLILLAITPGLASLTQFALPDGRRCEALDTNNPDFPNNCLTIVTISDSQRTAIENVSMHLGAGGGSGHLRGGGADQGGGAVRRRRDGGCPHLDQHGDGDDAGRDRRRDAALRVPEGPVTRSSSDPTKYSPWTWTTTASTCTGVSIP